MLYLLLIKNKENNSFIQPTPLNTYCEPNNMTDIRYIKYQLMEYAIYILHYILQSIY